MSAQAPPAVSAVELVAAERRRQIDVKGWTPAHDVEQGSGPLVAAALCYLSAPAQPWCWPWAEDYWKPTPEDRTRELTKAAALLVAASEVLLPRSTDRGRTQSEQHQA